MEKLVTTGRILYGSAMSAIGVHQLFYGGYTPMIVPSWPVQNIFYTLLAYAANAALAIAGIAIVINKQARNTCLYLAAVFILLFVTTQIPYELIFDPYYYHIVMWTNALKEFAFAGGALVIAGALPVNHETRLAFVKFVEKLIPYGHWLFATTMALFGVMHIKYIEHVSKLVPSWIPFPVFWTGFTGIALIGAGLCIVFRIKLTVTANLLGAMILLWFFILHIPRSIDNPFGNNGNEIASAFSALVFSGTAFIIANFSRNKITPVNYNSD